MKRIIDKNLFFVKNKDFHTIVIRVVFPMYELENDLANSILFSPLVSFMNEAYDTEDKFYREKQKNYILNTNVTRNIVGNNAFVSYNMVIPDVDSLKVDYLDEQFELFEKMIYHPKIIDGGFDEFEFERERKDLKQRIANGMKNLQVYHSVKLMEHIDTIGVIGRSISNHQWLIDEATRYNVYEYYKNNILNNSPIVFVFGNFDEEKIKLLCKKHLLKDETISYDEDYNHFLEPRDEVRVINEKSNFKDSILSLVYKVKNMTEDDFAKLSLVSGLLSSSSSRLLMKKLRDEEEIVYSAGSGAILRAGTLIIDCFINKNNKDLAYSKVIEVMESLKDSEFIKPFLKNIVERSRLNQLRLLDDKLSLLDDVVVKELGIDITSQEKHELIKMITSEEISEFVNRLVLDTVYFLEEEEHE